LDLQVSALKKEGCIVIHKEIASGPKVRERAKMAK